MNNVTHLYENKLFLSDNTVNRKAATKWPFLSVKWLQQASFIEVRIVVNIFYIHPVRGSNLGRGASRSELLRGGRNSLL